MTEIQLSELICMDSPQAIFEEVRNILSKVFPNINTDKLDCAFEAATHLFLGKYPGYRSCLAKYHDLQHTTDAFLAMARLIHGCVIAGEELKPQNAILSLIATLFHDSGYIQEENDIEGTGAKYTLVHVQRSALFLKKYGRLHNMADYEIEMGTAMILNTELRADPASITIRDKDCALLGRMLGAADLLAQMADRTYLEKILLLYSEFKEGGIGNFENEIDLLRKSLEFFDVIEKRLLSFKHWGDYMQNHFKSRWDLDSDLYGQAIEKHKQYLGKLVKMSDAEVLSNLRRGKAADKHSPLP